MHRNNYLFGFVIGMLIPWIGVLLVYMLRYMPNNISVSQFTNILSDNPLLVSSTLALGMLTNIPLFTFFKNRKLYKSLYGVFAAVGIYTAVIIVFRYNLI